MAIFEYINGFYNPRATALRAGLEKPGHIRTEAGLNEQLGRHKNGIGPDLTNRLSGLEAELGCDAAFKAANLNASAGLGMASA